MTILLSHLSLIESQKDGMNKEDFELLSEVEQMTEIEQMLKDIGEMLYCNGLRYALIKGLGEGVFYSIEEDYYKRIGIVAKQLNLSTKESRDMRITMCEKTASEHGIMLPTREDVDNMFKDKDTLN